MQYEDFAPKTRQELESALGSGDAERIREALLTAMYQDSDWQWMQEACLKFASHQDPRVRLAAAECLGGLARTRRSPLDFDRVLAALEPLVDDSEMGFAARDALDDIEFIRSRDS